MSGQVRGRSVEYSIGFATIEKIRDAIKLVPKTVWAPAIDADGGIREGGDVAELTGLLNMSGWPDGMRVIVRRERPQAPDPAVPALGALGPYFKRTEMMATDEKRITP